MDGIGSSRLNRSVRVVRARMAGARILLVLSLCLAGRTGAPGQEDKAPLRVCVTVPDLGSITRAVGGEHVEVTEFAKGPEDPHFLEPKPSFVKTLSEADLFIQVGMQLEAAWAPVLLQNARNGRVLPGAPGHLDASVGIAPLDIPVGTVDRSMGDVHPMGNPHYLSDPINGLKVARAIGNKLSELRPQDREYFDNRYNTFAREIGMRLVGEALASKYDVEKLALLFERDRLAAFLKEQGQENLLGGWLGAMLPYAGSKAVADHNLWPYFTRRFRLVMSGFMEPKPGITPTTSQLGVLVKSMREQGVRIILGASYYDPRHARFLAEQTGAIVVPMAQQTGAREGASDYVSTVDYNVRHVAAALAAAGEERERPGAKS